MKTLYMVRHAKSSWEFDLTDHKRPLNKRGEEDGILVAQNIKDKLKPPQKIVTSDATRAFSTAIYFKEAFGVSEKNFTTNNRLYDFGGNEVMNIIKSLDNSLDIVMIVGHNHAFTSIANMLGSNYIDNLPTCGFVALQFDENKWNNITAGATILTVFPRDLK